MTTERATPETDTVGTERSQGNEFDYLAMRIHAQKLERQRDELRTQVIFARGHLYTAVVQLADSDDKIIAHHIRVAHEALSAALKGAA